jgi:hypothetical protein
VIREIAWNVATRVETFCADPSADELADSDETVPGATEIACAHRVVRSIFPFTGVAQAASVHGERPPRAVSFPSSCPGSPSKTTFARTDRSRGCLSVRYIFQSHTEYPRSIYGRCERNARQLLLLEPSRFSNPDAVDSRCSRVATEIRARASVAHALGVDGDAHRSTRCGMLEGVADVLVRLCGAAGDPPGLLLRGDGGGAGEDDGG